MASVLATVEVAKSRVDLPAARPRSTSSAEEPLFHFGLRQLLVFVAAISTLLAAVVSSSGLWAMVLVMATVVVAMHVFATALGTRLQSRMEKARLWNAPLECDESVALAAERSAKLAAIRLGPRSPWHGRGCTYLPWLPRFIVVGMVLGGVAGMLVLEGAIGHRTTPAGIAVGATSFAVLSGWFAFLCGNFYGVFRHGFREALADEQNDQPQRGRHLGASSRRVTTNCE